MKNLLILAIALVTSVATAQNNPTNLVNLDNTPTIGKDRIAVDMLPDVLEVTITRRPLSTKVNAKLDAGHSQTFINFSPRKNSYVVKGTNVGKRGKNNRIEFNSTAAALAYFKSMGYNVSSVNGYAAPSGHTGLLSVLGVPAFSRGQRLILTK